MKTLKELARDFRARMSKSVTEPLVIAKDVLALATNWDKYEDEAKGLSCSAWLENVFGKGKNLAWFARRHDALVAIGEHARRTWDHEAAVWATSKIKDASALRVLDQIVQVATKRNGGNPLTVTRVRSLAKEAKLEFPARFQKCVRCVRLEWALIEAGVPIPK